MWVLDHLEDIASDLSVFHRVDDPMSLPSSRYFQLAERLVCYDGAVRAGRALRAAKERIASLPPVEPPRPAPQAGPATTRVAMTDISSMASLSHRQSGFPSIGYRS